MIKEKISVIIPVYNAEKFLDRCVQSVVDQTYKNLEIILVDDGSPDNSPKMCDEWAKKDSRIKVVHKQNGGVSSARNVGLENATGEFVQFVDSDDYIRPKYSESLINVMVEDVDLVVAGLEVIDDHKTCKKTCPKNGYSVTMLSDIDEFMQFILDGYFDITVNKLYRKNLITKSFYLGQALGEDRMFNLDYFRNIKNKIVTVAEVGYFYDFNPNSACHQKRKNQYQIFLVVNNYLKKFLIDIFGTSKHNIFYQLYLNNLYHVLIVSDEKEILKLVEQIKNDGIFEDMIKNYKPENWKEKIKFFLLKRHKFGMLRRLVRIRN